MFVSDLVVLIDNPEVTQDNILDVAARVKYEDVDALLKVAASLTLPKPIFVQLFQYIKAHKFPQLPNITDIKAIYKAYVGEFKRINQQAMRHDAGNIELQSKLYYYDTTYRQVQNFGGKPVVRRQDGIGAPMTYDAFAKSNMHDIVRVLNDEGELVKARVVPIWLSDKEATRYNHEELNPVGANENPGELMNGYDILAALPPEQRVYNHWKGFKPAIIEGFDLSRVLSEQCPLIREYLWNVISSRRQDVYEYEIKWIADAVQNPRRTAGRTAQVLRSDKGRVGKTTFFHLLQALFGPEHCYLSSRAKIWKDGSRKSMTTSASSASTKFSRWQRRVHVRMKSNLAPPFCWALSMMRRYRLSTKGSARNRNPITRSSSLPRIRDG